MKKLRLTLAGCLLMSAIIFSCEENTNEPATDCNTSGPSVTAIATEASCGGKDGSLEASGTGGKQPYQYSINGTSFQPATAFANLAAGEYTITIKDAAGCTSTATASIGTQSGGISYEATVKNIIATNCAISGCHVAGTGRPDFTDFNVIKARASAIKTRTGNKTMPIGRTLTDEQIAQIACWVDAGAPSN